MNPTAEQFELMFTTMLAVCGAVAAGVLLGLSILVVRYHDRRGPPRAPTIHNSTPWEVSWTVLTFVAFACLFWFGTRSYRGLEQPLDWPESAAPVHDVLVTGKRWMWKFEQPTGEREIDELHVPVGRPVRLHMSSDDVIHSFYVPAFRIKQDLLPGRTTTVWFEASEPGVVSLLCAEYCGDDHSNMRGRIVALEPEAFERWRAELASSASLTRSGEALFHAYQCDGCHVTRGDGPALDGIYGRRIALRDGSERVADDAYLRESIVSPAAAVVAGYEPSMPAYAGRLSERELSRLVLYLESLPEERPLP